jgi:hypothetical protein
MAATTPEIADVARAQEMTGCGRGGVGTVTVLLGRAEARDVEASRESAGVAVSGP